jgi:membrane associated rhomboid family serine protease
VEYQDGPYLADESADGSILFQAPKKLIPKGGSVKFMAANVHQGHVTVDVYDNFANHWPVFIVLISLVQVACFVYYCMYLIKPNEALGDHTPVAGPAWMWMQIVGDFPGCESLRAQIHRLLTYQFVHAGLQHVTFNVLIQVLFGLPLNMVHGSLRFGLAYELGVINGAFTWIQVLRKT